MKSKVGRYIVITIVVFSSVLLFIYLSNPQIFNCYTVFFSPEFNQVSSNVFVSKDTDKEYANLLNEFLDKADERVNEFWGTNKREGEPVIIYCDNDKLLEKYSKQKSILVYNTPLKQFIVIGQSFLDLDMLSHELMHTEFTEKIGYSNLVDNVPTWFNEGLALQVDYRNEYSYNKYLELKDSLGLNIDLDSIATSETFYSGDYYHNYLLAGAEVKEWLDKNDVSGLNLLIDNIINGMEFNKAYNKNGLSYGNTN